jgi:hypothetical protein
MGERCLGHRIYPVQHGSHSSTPCGHGTGPSCSPHGSAARIVSRAARLDASDRPLSFGVVPGLDEPVVQLATWRIPCCNIVDHVAAEYNKNEGAGGTARLAAASRSVRGCMSVVCACVCMCVRACVAVAHACVCVSACVLTCVVPAPVRVRCMHVPACVCTRVSVGERMSVLRPVHAPSHSSIKMWIWPPSSIIVETFTTFGWPETVWRTRTCSGTGETSKLDAARMQSAELHMHPAWHGIPRGTVSLAGLASRNTSAKSSSRVIWCLEIVLQAKLRELHAATVAGRATLAEHAGTHARTRTRAAGTHT